MLHQIYFNSWSLQPCSGPLYGTKIKTATVFTDQFCVLVFVRGGHERGSLAEAEAPRPTALPPFPPYLRSPALQMKAQSSKSTLWHGLWILSIQSKAEKEMRCRAWRGGSWATRPDTAPERCCCQLSKLWKRSLILPKKHKYFLKCITGQNWERNSSSNQPTKVRLSLDAVKIFCVCLKA